MSESIPDSEAIGNDQLLYELWFQSGASIRLDNSPVNFKFVGNFPEPGNVHTILF